MLPALSEVLLVQEALANAEAKVGQAHGVGGRHGGQSPPSYQTPYSRPWMMKRFRCSSLQPNAR